MRHTGFALGISIHAPPRGATFNSDNLVDTIDFNSRPSARGDSIDRVKESNFYLFQFTPLREGRPFGYFYIDFLPHDFNSRPSARGDGTRARCLQRTAYFNSRPSARGDDNQTPVSRCTCIFQFTPLREGRHFFSRFSTLIIYFNSRPSARGDISSADFQH